MTRAKKLEERATKALDMLVTRQREVQGYAVGDKTADHWKAPDMDLNRVMRGVTVGWLAQALHLNHAVVKKKLAACPVLDRKKDGFVYDLKTALPYLVKPQFDIEEYLQTARIEDLPLRLQTEYWAAKNRRREFEEASGQLWRTEQIVTVFGEVFQTMKHTMQLWVQNLEATTGLSEVQRKVLTGMVDSLQDELHSRLVKLADSPKTKSIRDEDREHEKAEEEARKYRAAQAEVEEPEEIDIASII